jgi:hypothetical protein
MANYWGLIASGVSRGIGMYQEYQAARDQRKAYERQLKVNKQLAAESLAKTYNSINAMSVEAKAKADRASLEIAVRGRQVEGQLVAQAAATGAAGKRVDLSRAVAVKGGTERAMTALEIDAKRQQDALIAQADAAERQMVHRLISNTPDLPAPWDPASSLLENAAGYLQDYGQWKQQQDTETGAQYLHRSDKRH